jgi:VWFA-related protein
VAFACTAASAQSSPPGAQPAGEVTTREAPLTFKTKVNLVSIPVVVRDARDHGVGTLSREDFQLTDNGHLQTISRFSVEKFGTAPAPEAPPPAAATPGLAPAPLPPPAMPERYVAYFFDDINTPFDKLAQAREAAFRHIAAALLPAERAAVYTASGEGGIDFTGDRDKLHKALLAIRIHNPIVQSSDCPPLTIYQAKAILDDDVMALAAAESDYLGCKLATSDEKPAGQEWSVRIAAKTVVALADRNIVTFLASFDGVIRKLSVMAGQRVIVLVSSGFVMLDDRREQETAVLGRALRAGVVVNALDARALQALAPGLDASAHTTNTQIASLPSPGAPLSGGSATGTAISSLSVKMQEGRAEELVKRDILAESVAATGGRLFENNNDLEGGFARIAAAPEYIYVLGFVPQSLKLDGKYHSVKVSLRNSKGITVEARRGYYAPRYATAPGELSQQEVEEAFFSREETSDIPAAIQTQFFKTGDREATLTVTAKIDVRQLPFRKDGDRNRDDLTVVAGLFDSDGNYVVGSQKVVEMRLRDETMRKGLASGISVRNTFQVAPGTYFVRLVVRDAEGQTMAAHGATVEIQ